MFSGLGNVNLIYPVGLIIADEIAFAGGMFLQNNYSYFLYTGNYFWTLSSGDFHFGGASVWRLNNTGGIYTYGYTNDTGGLRPVISFKSDITFSGDGSMNSPFEIIS